MTELEAAYNIGTTGAPHTEAERQLFMEYLRGHCWDQGLWNESKQYYEDYITRMLYAVWRARAAVSSKVTASEPKYNPNFGDHIFCTCGHNYYKHFDPYEDMAFVGCKFCGCQEFEQAEKP